MAFLTPKGESAVYKKTVQHFISRCFPFCPVASDRPVGVASGNGCRGVGDAECDHGRYCGVHW